MSETLIFSGVLYTKTIRGTKADGKAYSFPKLLIKTDKGTFDCVLCGELKSKKFSYPQAVEFTAKQHFVKTEDYTDGNGEIKSKNVVFLTGIESHWDTAFGSRTLDDVE